LASLREPRQPRRHHHRSITRPSTHRRHHPHHAAGTNRKRCGTATPMSSSRCPSVTDGPVPFGLTDRTLDILLRGKQPIVVTLARGIGVTRLPAVSAERSRMDGSRSSRPSPPPKDAQPRNVANFVRRHVLLNRRNIGRQARRSARDAAVDFRKMAGCILKHSKHAGLGPPAPEQTANDASTVTAGASEQIVAARLNTYTPKPSLLCEREIRC
jgi:hypothetical protein